MAVFTLSCCQLLQPNICWIFYIQVIYYKSHQWRLTLFLFLVCFPTYQQFWIFNAIMPYNMGYLYQLNFERHFWIIVPYLFNVFFSNNVLLLLFWNWKIHILNFILRLKRKTNFCFCSKWIIIYSLKTMPKWMLF